MMTKLEPLTKQDIFAWWPIFLSAATIIISVMFTYSEIKTQLELSNQKIDALTEAVEKLTDKYSSVEGRYGTLSLKIQRLETVVGLEPLK